MSPEIVNEESHDYGVDIWCLGILLYEMLHGNPPFHAENLNEIKQEFQKKKIQVNPKFDKDTIDLIDRLLQYNSENRISIEEALEHRAIKKNLKHIKRKITQEEYNLLTRYYYMNSGGNQLMTHNSTYARQLKRQSMLTKTSQASYRSNDSGFFDKGSIKNKSNFFDSNSRYKGMGKEALNPSDLNNNFIPNMMMDDAVNQEVKMSNKLANSAFKKKPEVVPSMQEVVPPSNMDTHVSERSLDFFKSESKKSPNVTRELTPVDVSSPISRNFAKDSNKTKGYTTGSGISKKSDNQKKLQKQGKNLKSAKKDKQEKQGSGVKGKSDFKNAQQKSGILKKKANDPLKIANENLMKEGYMKSSSKIINSKGMTTLKEFQQKYNAEKFKEKFQQSENNQIKEKKNPKEDKIDKKGGSNIKKESKEKSLIKSKNNTNPNQEIRSARAPLQKKLQVINTPFSKNGVQRTISKSPSTGTFYTPKSNYSNLREAVKSNVKAEKREKTQERKKEDSNVTSVSKPQTSIFTHIQTKRNLQKTPDQTNLAFKSVNSPHTTSPTIVKYKSDKGQKVTTHVRTHLTRTEVQKVRATGGSQVKLAPLKDASLEGKLDQRNASFSRIQVSTERSLKDAKFNQTQAIPETFKEEQADFQQRYSLGVRSRTLEGRSSEPRRRIEELLYLEKNQGQKVEGNKPKLSEIFEEPSPLKKEIKNKKTPNSLFQHLKNHQKQKFINLKDIDKNFQKSESGKSNGRSKSTDAHILELTRGARGQFNKRVVYVNGVKTEKFIYSKSNKESNKSGEKMQNELSEQKKNSNVGEKKEKDSEENQKEALKEEKVEEKSIKKSNEEKSEKTKDSEKKKKYKIITVPQTKARVHVEGGLKFSNVKPITIIQQGTFALSTSRTKEQSGKVSSKNLEKEETSRNKSVAKKEETKRTPDRLQLKRGEPKRETSTHKTRVISYEEYKKRIQRTLEENQKSKSPLKSNKTQLNLKNISEEQTKEKKEAILRMQNKSVEIRRIEAESGRKSNRVRVVSRYKEERPQETGLSTKAYLNKTMDTSLKQPNKGNVKYVSNKTDEKDNINTLVKKLEMINQNGNNEKAKNKTTGSISLNTLIRQVNQEIRFPGKVKTETSYNMGNPLMKQVVNGPTKQALGHKKNKTMYNINQENLYKEVGQYVRVKSGSSFNNQVPKIEKKPSISKGINDQDANFFRTTQNRYSQKNNVKNPENINYVVNQPHYTNLSRPNSSRLPDYQNVKIYSKNPKTPTYYENSYKSDSRRQVNLQNRASQGRREWKQVLESQGTMKHSNSVKKLSTNQRTGSTHKSVSVMKNGKHNYTYQVVNNVNNLQGGNVTTTIRRYTVKPSPSTNKYTGGTQVKTGSRNLTPSTGIPKKQIFTNFNELKKNLKTNFYNQN